MAYRLLRLAAAPALAAFLVVGMALPASAATSSDHASATATAQSSSSNAGGNSAGHANENAGANANAANNPHSDVSSDSSSSQSASSSQAASTPATSTSSNTSAGNPNQGCNQTPYGSTGPGANHSGPYDDTCTGAASGNGNGGGKAVGKPCAGCVGKADEKNPKGQYPGGSDHNKGYECDGNHGIGQTNPAHTGCTPPPPPPPPSTPPENPPSGTEVSRTPTEVLGEVLLKSPATVEAATAARGALPRTGMDLLDPTLLGAALLALGAMLLKLAKRRPA